MPSQLALPTAQDSLRIGKRAIVATRDELVDDRTGSIYDFLMGTAALAWAREAQTDRDKFRAIYFMTAQNDDLTDYVKQRFGIDRILDTQGTGQALFERATTSAGAGTIYKGTRFLVNDLHGGSIAYQVTANAVCGATQKQVAVSIQAIPYGLGVAINDASGPVIDPLFDTFTAVDVYCQNGTVFEPAANFRARVVQELLDQRPGYPTLIKQTLLDAGASQVILFPSNYQGTDSGINCAYVGDSGFGANNSLLIACRKIVETSRVLGADLQVLGMSSSTLSIDLTVSLWDDPANFDQLMLKSAVVAGVIQYFTDPTNAFAYKVDGIRGAAQRVSNAIQTVVVNTPSVDATFSSTSWPATLTRYMPNSSSISVALQGPS